jgi:type II secretory pathway predicted ATPase ExeA
MSTVYRNFFGFSKEPFSADLEIKNIIQTSEIKAAHDGFDYAVELEAIALVTGEIGAGGLSQTSPGNRRHEKQPL